MTMAAGFQGLMLARVIKFHPHDHSCDLAMYQDGSRVTAVPVLCGMVSNSSGTVDLHQPEGVDWDGPTSGARDVVAVVGAVSGQPVVVGFLAPAVSQMLFLRPNFRVQRHASDVYSTIDQHGNLELAHPSGTHLRIATDPEHEDLSGQDFDREWAITRNTGTAPWVSLVVASGGSVKAQLRISPQGNITLEAEGSISLQAAGSLSLTAPAMTIHADLSINGSSLTHNGTHIGNTHTHGGITPGTAQTSAPS